eukprot:CFRG7365T1
MSGKRPGDPVGPAADAKKARSAMTPEQIKALVNSTKAQVEQRVQKLGLGTTPTTTPPTAAGVFKMPAPVPFKAPLPPGQQMNVGASPAFTAHSTPSFKAPMPPNGSTIQPQCNVPIQPQQTAPLSAKPLTSVQSSARALAEQLKARLGTNFTSKYAHVLQPDDNKIEKDVAPASLRIDESGRLVDAEGNVIQMPNRMNTLKANVRARQEKEQKEKDRINGLDKEKEITIDATSSFYDPRMSVRNSTRVKRPLKLNEPGKFERKANNIRAKAMIEKLEKEIGEAAKKTGISSSTKLALLTPKDTQGTNVPDAEWWDVAILSSGKYPTHGESLSVDLNMNVTKGDHMDTSGDDSMSENVESTGEGGEKEVTGSGMHGMLRGITALIEHPVQYEPPAEAPQDIAIPLYLTKKERVKIRRQRRREAWLEEQEKIRLGLVVPQNKLKLSNFMNALKDDAVADPTKLEKEVREQMAQRKAAHEDANAARQLTVEQRREKKDRKLTEDVSVQVQVMIFRLKNLKDYQKRYKVDVNATQFHLTGGVIATPDLTLVVAEGGPKNMKKYKRLMLNRIKWEEKRKPRGTDHKRSRRGPDGELEIESDSSDEDDENRVPNSCTLVWEGVHQKPAFSEWMYKKATSTVAAREFLEEYGMENVFDLALTEIIVNPSQDSVF